MKYNAYISIFCSQRLASILRSWRQLSHVVGIPTFNIINNQNFGWGSSPVAIPWFLHTDLDGQQLSTKSSKGPALITLTIWLIVVMKQ